MAYPSVQALLRGPALYSEVRHRLVHIEESKEVSMTDTTARGAGPAERAHHAGGDGAAPARRRRMSAKRKQSAVLRLLRGEDLELVSRELGVMAAELTAWRDAFLAAGEASLKTRPADDRDLEIGRLKAKVGDLTMTTELLEAKIERLEGGRPLARRRSRP
jgi:transposase